MPEGATEDAQCWTVTAFALFIRANVGVMHVRLDSLPKACSVRPEMVIRELLLGTLTSIIEILFKGYLFIYILYV